MTNNSIGDPSATAPNREVRRRSLGRRLAPMYAVAVLGVGVLAGCGGSSSSSSSNTTAASSSSSSDTSASSDTTASSNTSTSTDPAAFLAAIKSQPHFSGISDANLTTLGNDVCKDFAQGGSLNATEADVVKGINEINANDEESGNNPGGSLTPEDAGFLIGASVKGLCPQYQSQLGD